MNIKREPRWVRFYTTDDEVWMVCSRCGVTSTLVKINSQEHGQFISQHKECKFPSWLKVLHSFDDDSRNIRCTYCGKVGINLKAPSPKYDHFLAAHTDCLRLLPSKKGQPGLGRPKGYTKYYNPVTNAPESRHKNVRLVLTPTAKVYYDLVIGKSKGLEKIAHGYFANMLIDGEDIPQDILNALLVSKGKKKER